MNRQSISGSRLFRWNVLAVIAITVFNWYVFASLGIGLLLVGPVLLSSLGRHERDIWVTSILAVTGYLLTAAFTQPPEAWGIIWIPNLVLETLTLLAATAVSLLLHRQRVQLKRNELHNRRSDELGRLLITLFAHDVRTPIMSALQGFEYVSHCVSDGNIPDLVLLLQLRDRLRRHLLVADSILSIVRADQNAGDAAGDFNRLSVDLADKLTRDVEAFSAEAATRGMRLLIDVDELQDRLYTTDFLVLRQALSVLLDNAIRYANPGFIRVTALMRDEELRVNVQDHGPGLAGDTANEGGHGMGLALQLSRMLLERVGGRLEVVETGPQGTHLALIVPAEVAAAA